MRHNWGEGPQQLMAAFNPDQQIRYCRDIERVYFGKAPSIRLVANAYGSKTAESWLEIQLNDLSEYAGCKEKLTTRQISETAAMMAETYPHYKLTEMMLFFQRFKRCCYGRFYGTVDPMIIMQALDEFDEERRKVYIEREAKETRERKVSEDQTYTALRQRYKDRVPDAFTANAPINFMQYRLMGFDGMNDARLATELDAIRTGTREIPTDGLDLLQAAFGIEE